MQGIFADSAVFRENLSLKRRKISMFGENSLRGAQGIISPAQGIISALPWSRESRKLLQAVSAIGPQLCVRAASAARSSTRARRPNAAARPSWTRGRNMPLAALGDRVMARAAAPAASRPDLRTAADHGESGGYGAHVLIFLIKSAPITSMPVARNYGPSEHVRSCVNAKSIGG